MSQRKRLLVLMTALMALACVLPGVIAPVSSGPVGSSGIPLMVLAPPGSTATATPFQPLPPTPTYLPTSFPTPTIFPTPTLGISSGATKTWSDYPGPTVWPDITIPPPMGILSQPEGQVNILLLGSDQRPYEGGFRTDTIILVTLSPAQGITNMTSFPRDLYVYIPGWTVQRINTAFGYGGFAALAQTFEYNFGVLPDNYVLINFWSFANAIDSLGGLEVDVGQNLCDHRDSYGTYCVYAGRQRMDGETALWYVRSRYTSSDFDRGRRQQEIVKAGFEKLISLDAISRAPELFEIYRSNVTTDLTFEAVSPLLPLAVQLTENPSINHYFIGPQQVVNWVNYSGAQVLLPIREAVLEVMRQALNSPE